MAQTTVTPQVFAQRSGGGRTKFLIGGAVIIAAIVYLIVTSLQSTAQFFYTVQEVQARGQGAVGQSLRVSGAVLGDSIQFDSQTLTISFMMANLSNDNKAIEAAGGLAAALHTAAIDPNTARIKVVYVGPKPDLLKDEAQAIVTGKLGQDGVFYADELLLKCPTRYEESVPAQAQGSN